jgi:putative membrane protein
MLLDALLAYTHFVAIIATATTLGIEAVLCRPGIRWPQVRLLGRIDLFYFGAAILALASGLARVFWGLKGAPFYLQNPVFYVKIGLFLVVALVSIAPTIQFIRWARQAESQGDKPVPLAEVVRTRRFVVVELGLLALIPLAAVLMARGFGY